VSTLVLSAGTVASASGAHRPGWVEIDGERGTVLAVGAGPAPVPASALADAAAGADALAEASADGAGAAAAVSHVDLGADAVIVPGFVDMHVHGGGGGAFTDESVEAQETAVATHRAHGTTRMLASLVTAHPEALLEQVARLATLTERGVVAGIHLEGPWLSRKRKGAHDETALRAPEPGEIDEVLAAGRGTVRMVTLAPELPGALAAIERFVDAGVVVAIGHTDASYEVVSAAVDAGATVGTHLFNAMRPIKHREPGPIVALMERPEVTVELIVDGVHLHPAMHAFARQEVGPSRIALVTDAMAATGMPDGDYRIGELPVTVKDGAAVLAGTDTIAGSTATTDVLFRTVLGGRIGDDEALLEAIEQASVTPARAVGLEIAALEPGHRADLVVFSGGEGAGSGAGAGELAVERVMVAGRWA